MPPNALTFVSFLSFRSSFYISQCCALTSPRKNTKSCKSPRNIICVESFASCIWNSLIRKQYDSDYLTSTAALAKCYSCNFIYICTMNGLHGWEWIKWLIFFIVSKYLSTQKNNSFDSKMHESAFTISFLINERCQNTILNHSSSPGTSGDNC